MLPRRYRGLAANDIETLFKKKHSSRSNRSFLLIWRKNDEAHSRFAVIIPLKLKISAVKRNKIKRKVFALLRKAPISWTEGKNYAILVRSHALTISPLEIEKQVLSLFSRG